jgi:hypothetical protein
MNILKLTCITSLMFATIGTAFAAPLEEQAQLLYKALKTNTSTEAIYTYCTNHAISAEQIVNETKKICEANNDWDTYSKATELEIAWEDRMQSISTPVKIAAALGAVATVIGVCLLYKYLKKPAQEIPPVVPPVVLPHPMPNSNIGAGPRPNPLHNVQIPMVEGHAQPGGAFNPLALNQLRAALARNPQARLAAENPQAQNLEQLFDAPEVQQMLNTPAIAGFLAQDGIWEGLQNLANNANITYQIDGPAFGDGAPQVNFQQTVEQGVRTQTRTEESVNNGVRSQKTTTIKTYNY